MTPMVQIVFRIDAGPEYGMGHLARAMVIAGRLSGRGIGVRAILGPSGAQAAAILEDAGIGCTVLGTEKALSDGLSSSESGSGTIIMIDMATPSLTRRFPNLAGQLAEMCGRAAVSVFFDALGPQSLHEQHDLPVSIVVVPYIGARPRATTTPCTELLGPRYFVLGEEFTGQGERRLSERAERVLLTCGGSDPKGVTVRALAELLACPELMVRVILGPMFSEASVRTIRDIAQQALGRVDLVVNPPSLAAHMEWADMAVSTTGLTKYELAAVGLPAVFVSIDESHDLVHRPFADCHTGIDLGTIDGLEAGAVSKATMGLAVDRLRRIDMSRRGRALIDSRGADRIISRVEDRCALSAV